ncbi:MAG: hypothetical protein KC912_14180 [Proteobacteria bacterium]|nr:hypothetical protein [Pseudomonadota bacterium]
MEGFDTAVLVWWGGLSAIAILNLLLLAGSARRVLAGPGATEELGRYRRAQLLFSAIYVVGCASRSFILRSDGRRYAMFDSFVTSVFVGRTTATVAEMAFVVQWALLLYLLSKRSGDGLGMGLAKVLVPIIAVAEVFSWYGILTTNAFGHAVEESLWTVTAVLFMVGIAMRVRDADPVLKRFLVASIAVCLLYLAYMITTDVPTYYFRWQEELAAGKDFLTVAEGFGDSMRWEVKRTWADWQREVVWQSLYFSLAVWGSLLLIHLPRFPAERGD